MAKITKIEPQIPALPTRKKVAAYARVSMETERLHHSLSSQVSYYSELIQKNPEWEYVGVYADEAITGTIAKKRDEFKRLIADCDAGKIDIVLCKSISRFARNTVDLLETVRHLKELGISVRFEKENIDSLSGDGEVMLTLLASFAQSESESISNNVKWGVRKRMERGIPNGHFRIFGYRWEGDQLVIVPEEAAIVKRIYQNFLDGKSRLETEREFAAEGITTREGCRWVDSNIKVVLSNITYTGNMLLQKEYIADPISKKRKKNHGELKQYYVEDTHEPIIDMETFQYVQSEMARRKELGALANKSLNITCFTSKIKCEKCGKSYVRNTRKNRAKVSQLGDQLVGWVCGSSKTKNGKCKAMEIPEYILRQKCAEALGLEEFDEDAFAEQVEVITVPEQGILNFHMTDGTEKTLTWVSTAKKDAWTPEARKKASSYRRNHAMKRDDVTCFTSKIKCADCGNNYRRQTRTKASGEKYHLFVCATTNTCSNNCIHEDTLRELTAQALGQQELDEAVFLKEIDHITIAPGGHITFCFYDGHEVSMEYSTKRRMPAWTEERKKKQGEAIKASFTEERRRKMSETMKKIRSEKYWASTKAKR
ncbi:MAG: recombinase family protein [Saccharofermentanales bacterium]